MCCNLANKFPNRFEAPPQREPDKYLIHDDFFQSTVIVWGDEPTTCYYLMYKKAYYRPVKMSTHEIDFMDCCVVFTSYDNNQQDDRLDKIIMSLRQQAQQFTESKYLKTLRGIYENGGYLTDDDWFVLKNLESINNLAPPNERVETHTHGPGINFVFEVQGSNSANAQMEFKSEIIQTASLKAHLVFVKVPDTLNDLTVNNEQSKVTGTIAEIDGTTRWTSDQIPGQEIQFVGYVHKLDEIQILRVFRSRREFHEICELHQIFHDFSGFTGKWAVLARARNVDLLASKG